MKITRLPSGTYRTLVYLGKDANGKKKYKSLTDKDKKKLAVKAATYADLYREAPADSFGACMESFISSRTAILSPSTIRGYKSIQTALNAVYGRFCALQVQDIRPHDVQAVIDALAREGRSPKTIRNYSAFISAVLTYAEVPVPKVKLPAAIKPDDYIPDVQTMKNILRDVTGTRLEVPVNLAILGFRRGEICGLSIDDLDGDVLHIHNTKVYDFNMNLVNKSPKTYDSDRYVMIPEAVADKIRAQGYITDYTPTALSRAWQKFLETHNYRPFRFHSMRAFFVSYAHNVLHLSDKQIQKIGGWRTPYVFQRHYLRSMEDEAAARKVARAFGEFV